MPCDNCYRCIYFGIVDNYVTKTASGGYVKRGVFTCSHPKVLEFFNDRKFTLIGKAWYYCMGSLETKVPYKKPPEEKVTKSKKKVKDGQKKLYY